MKIKLKINKALLNHKPGDVIPIEVDERGTPLDKYWRNRLKDSVVDGCVEPVKGGKKPKT